MAYSKEYLKELQKLHSKSAFGSGKEIPKPVIELLDSGEVKSMLDFGSGKGLTSLTVKEKYPHIKLYTYDPVTSPISLPDKVDLVYSSDVLEHIEPHLLDATLKDLFTRAQKYQYHLIACHPAKKQLSDGRNAHLIIEKPIWWKAKLSKFQWNTHYEETTEKKLVERFGIYVQKYITVLKK